MNQRLDTSPPSHFTYLDLGYLEVLDSGTFLTHYGRFTCRELSSWYCSCKVRFPFIDNDILLANDISLYREGGREREREREGKVGVVTILLNLPEIIGREYVFVNMCVCLWREE